jgi:hypothetical protein
MRWQDDVSEADYNMNINGNTQSWDGSHGDAHAHHQPASPIDQPLPLGKQVSNLDHIVCLLLTSLAGQSAADVRKTQRRKIRDAVDARAASVADSSAPTRKRKLQESSNTSTTTKSKKTRHTEFFPLNWESIVSPVKPSMEVSVRSKSRYVLPYFVFDYMH